jgi:hypothetical protein
MRYFIAAVALCAAGCSVETEARRPYAEVTPVIHQVEAATYGPGELEVRLGRNKAWVGPKIGWWRSHILSRSSIDRWLATIESQKEVYQKALMLSLKDRGTCSVTSSTPAPSYFAFEFGFDCTT